MKISELDALRIELDPIGQTAVAVALMVIIFSVALSLRVRDFRIIKTNPLTYFAGVGAQLIGLPLLTLGMLHVLQPPPSVSLGMIVVACCPGGAVSNLLTYLSRGAVAYSVALTATSSLLAAIVTPVSILFWSNAYAPTAELLKTIDVSPALFLMQTMALLGIPLIAGMIVAARAPDVAERLRRFTAPLGAGVLGGAILYGFYLFLPILYPAMFYLFGIAAIHNGVAFALGALTGIGIRADKPTRIALVFEIGIQNSGLALVILIGQLAGLGGAAAIAAVWGVWHLIAGGAIVLVINALRRRQFA
ncbi:MAG: bile acid:sodium symporter family protein [Pseudomonadota bacterium]